MWDRQADEIEFEREVEQPSDRGSGAGREHAFERDRGLFAATKFEHEHQADEWQPHQCGNAGRPSTQAGRTRDASCPRSRTEGRTGRDAEVCGRCLGPQRRAHTDRRDDRCSANRCQAPREPFLLARGGDHIGGEVGACEVEGKRQPWPKSDPTGSGFRFEVLGGGAVGDHLQEYDGQRKPQRRGGDQHPVVLSRHHGEKALDRIGQPCGDRGSG